MRKARSNNRFAPIAAIAAAAITALAMWPALAARITPAAGATPAPLVRDYLTRDRLIGFFERQVRAAPRDQIQMRMLAQQYMQRYRERFDTGDLVRARYYAERSVRLQPQGNTPARMALASVDLSYHDFARALRNEEDAFRGEPDNVAARAQIGSLQMELGRYRSAAATLAGIRSPRENPQVDAVRARLEELTGHLRSARARIDAAARTADGDIGDSAYDRSWYHLRAGQLAFEAGDYAAASRQYRLSLSDFPDNALALMWQARLFRAQGRWQETLEAARRSAALYPLPQTLGYEADAQRALGDLAAARATDALIDAEQRLYNTNGINDRLLALYYASRGTHLEAALQAARRDMQKRGNEIYADDTLAWVLAKLGRWREAYGYSKLAMRTGVEDPEVRFHAGTIAMHAGHVAAGRALVAAALRLNPQFDPFEAPQARAELAAQKNRTAAMPSDLHD
ncbi:MAG TPA: tetratricopeptide repeat protein [Candidatus Aquilonibacter sp.]|nr:tetratricopeptide repeat protein [Candidatus Aquilonibacter sp.]